MAKPLMLIEPSIEWREPYMSFYEEWKESGESIVPWVVEQDPTDFVAYVRFLNEGRLEELIPDGWVPHSTYWLADSDRNIVGAVNIRHSLNEKLLNSGGHIGYGIRPSERRQGYASVLLSLALGKLAELGTRKALLVCDKGNTGSERTILNNGGELESEFIEEDGNVVRRFWIVLR